MTVIPDPKTFPSEEKACADRIEQAADRVERSSTNLVSWLRIVGLLGGATVAAGCLMLLAFIFFFGGLR